VKVEHYLAYKAQVKERKWCRTIACGI
jgi:hypothetical protein